MRTVEVAEFCERPEAVLAATDPVTVLADGTPVGFYVPAARSHVPAVRDRTEGREALARLGVAVDALCAATGVTEDDLVAAFTKAPR